jgi:glycosyltransferase involved in cell wall biosynthesis
VLILRSCRAPEFAAAVRRTRARHAGAEIVALTHRGHRDELVAAGVDRIVEIPGHRFGLLRIAPWTLARLRSERVDETVVPQMSACPDVHVNLYWIVAALGCASVLILADGTAREFRRREFLAYTLRHSLGGLIATLDVPIFLGLLASACLARRRRARDTMPGERQRVLHIISSLGVGGAQRQLAELINRTPVGRYDVDILVLGRSDGEFAKQWISRDDVSVTYLSEWPRLSMSVLEVRRHCARGRYDLVHTWLFMANVVGVAGARLAGARRVVASVRNLSLWKRTWYRQWWFRAADTLSSHAADEVTVNARALVGDHASWAWYPSRRIRVMHNGLDPSQFLVGVDDARARVRRAAGLPDDAVVVGTVGRLAPEKDHLTFLRTIHAVRRLRPDVHGVIVGEGTLRAGLETAAADLGLGHSVTFLGERSDARQIMAGFDVFVLTSTIEGFPNVLLEAAFLGVPSVASRAGGSPDVLPDSGDTFETGDHAAAARRVLSLLDEPALAAGGAHRLRQRATALFTADRAAARWFALYDRSPLEETVQ